MVLDAPASGLHAPTEVDSDHQLVASVRRGDDRAFETLYTRYQRRISAYVYGMVKDHGRAEDITQEVFMSALRRMRDTDRPIAFKPWIYEIAKNACIDQFRRSRRAEEVSFDAGEGLGPADQGRLVTSDPSPDAALNSKQQLDHLCGAFGGLADSHHEILVLREFEGLSYREIGDRMGLSRPGVESTLFRARKRLTEEYDELVSGQRCMRIQSIIASASEAMLGARDSRRLARHIAHCQPCRRQTMAAGLDADVAARKPLRQRVGEKAAAFLPIPAFLRSRGWFGGEHIVPVSEPMAAAWSKAIAAGAALVVAGAGAGIATQVSGGDRDGVPDRKPAVERTSSSGVPAAEPSVRRASLASRPAAAAPARTRSRATKRRKASPGAAPGGTSNPTAAQNRTAGTSLPTSDTVPAAAQHGGGGVRVPAAEVPKLQLPATPILPDVSGGTSPSQTAGQVVDTVRDTVSDATQPVDDVVPDVPDVPDVLPPLGG